MINVSVELNKLLIYRNILQDPLIALLPQSDWSNSEPGIRMSAGLIRRAEELGLAGNILANYLIYLVAEDENIFSSMVEKTGGQPGMSLRRAAIQDVARIKECVQASLSQSDFGELLGDYRPTRIREDAGFAALRESFLDFGRKYTVEETTDRLIDYYVNHGYGELAKSPVLRWERADGLTAVSAYDRIMLTDIVGYERQKQALLRNTEAFVNGRTANNVLLAGARGTGKSSCVKALVNQYFQQGLRLVEVAKPDLKYLHEIMDALRDRGKKFLVFLDDLSFEEYEMEYKILKSVLEGGASSKPDNLLFYATSNRRHLVKEVWNDRDGADIHAQDAVHEKVSLADRFGLTVTFTTPSQEEYLAIVAELARREKLTLDDEQLQAAALQWEMSHSGRSGRVARQLIAHLAGDVIGS